MSSIGPPLADVLDSVRSGAWGSDVATGERPIPVRVVRNGDISEDRRILFESIPKRWVSERELNNSIVSDRDTLIVGSGYIGKSARLRGGGMMFREPIIASNFIRIITPNSRTDPGWLFWLLGLDSAINFMKRVSAGTSLQNLPTSFFREWKVPFYPSFERQKYVSTVLDSVEKAIEQADNVITKAEQLRDALLHELLTRGIPGHHTEWKEAPGLGTIPATWQVVRLGEIVDIVGGSTPSRNIREYWEGNIPWVIPSELTELTSRYLSSTNEMITEEGLLSGGLKIIPAGSVLLTTRATIGVVAINLVPVTTNQGFQNLIPKDRIDLLWLYYYMTMCNKELNRRGSGSTFKEISRANVKSLPVIYPPLPEQNSISLILDSIDNYIYKFRSVATKTIAFRVSLMNQLLTNPRIEI